MISVGVRSAIEASPSETTYFLPFGRARYQRAKESPLFPMQMTVGRAVELHQVISTDRAALTVG